MLMSDQELALKVKQESLLQVVCDRLFQAYEERSWR
jgi:hypothetical protein